MEHANNRSLLDFETSMQALNRTSWAEEFGEAIDELTKQQIDAVIEHLPSSLIAHSTWSPAFDCELCTYQFLTYETGQDLPTRIGEHLAKLAPRIRYPSGASAACDLLAEIERFSPPV